MKILLTGATGFVGSSLLNALADKGHDISVLVRNRKRKAEDFPCKVTLFYGDITKAEGMREALKGIEVIIHLAGLTKALSWEEYYNANAKSCGDLLDARDLNTFKQFIFTSSQAALGPSKDGNPKKEEDGYAPLSRYGESKMMGEEIVKKAGACYTIIRPSSIYGENDHEFYPLFKSVRRGFKLILGDGKKSVNMLYVKDLVRAILLIAGNEKAYNKVYNVCDGFSYNWIDINNAAEKASGRKCRTIKLPMFTAGALAYINTLIEFIVKKPLLLNKEKLKEMKESYWLMSCDKIKNELGFKCKTSLEEGFKNAFDWYIQKGWIKRIGN
jgi:nucleoside-diphosphate-sugar epimerase